MQYIKIFLTSLICCVSTSLFYAQSFKSLNSSPQTSFKNDFSFAFVQGRVVDAEGTPVFGASVYVKELSIGATTDIEGRYRLKIESSGTYVLRVSFLGYKTYQKKISVHQGEEISIRIVLQQASENLETVVISAKNKIQQLEAMAYNVDVLDAKGMKNTTLSAGEALNQVAGVRVRQSGGVGSRMNLSINGFTGKQVKVFIDGVPMENFGSSFQLNNIPVGFAKRIEVYKGVVPIRLGADALGGAINIVTNKYEATHVNLSYAYGSFNTHQSSLNAVYVAKSGFTARLKAFQNYSDNSYKVEVGVADLETGEYFSHQEVRRFHDMYHNETVIAEVGVVNTSYADRLLFGINIGQNYQEIQTGARLVSVFGAMHTEGTIIMPTLKYKKTDFLWEGLDVDISANYNFGEEKIIDTLHRRYNWFGQYKTYSGPGGERNYANYVYRNNNGVATANLNYEINPQHAVSVSNVASTFDRKGSDKLAPEDEIYQQPRKSFKNVLGLGYRFKNNRWSSSVFLKHYTQINTFAQSYNPTGIYGDIAYRNRENTFNKWGYGITGSYFITDNFQLKASYEKSYRLPSASELFGNLVTLEGNIDLDPEKSNNYNIGASYWTTFSRNHLINIGANIFYRDASDFIRPRLNKNQAMQVMDNLFSVTNLGGTAEFNYAYKNAFSIGFNMTYQDLRNNTKYVAGQTTESIVYRDRIPNMSYLFGNLDAAYSFTSPFRKEDEIRMSYNLAYVHSFFLFWPSLGNNKFDIPKQISHNLNVTYTLGKKDNFQLSLACRNITNNKLYDNFSLQKPGRSFSAKINYSF